VRGLDPDVLRRGLLGGVAGAWLIATALLLALAPQPAPPVLVVHWANGHLMDPALLPTFAERFNAAGYRTESGKRIEVQTYLLNSSQIRREMVRRVQTGMPINRSLPDPAVVTPAAEHWLHDVNNAVNAPVVDVSNTKNLVTTWLGIATFREMAECLGWPGRDIGFSDIVELASDPAGWTRLACARADWGSRPLVTYTDPKSSTTGRGVLFALYSAAAGKAPQDLREEDVRDERITEYIRGFQRTVAHYVPDTLVLMDEIFGGPRYGHFFFIAEDDLVKLYKGKVVPTDTEIERIYGRKKPAGPIDRSMVMLYPREGAAAFTHPAAPVQADWVTAEQAEAARKWISFLQEDAQQSAFMDEGFRPATALALRCPICGQFGIDPRAPKVTVNPNAVPPAVGEWIVESWGDVKNPGVVVFVVDNSPSMAGQKLSSAHDGIVRAVDAMYHRNLVGLLTYSTSVIERVDPAPVVENRLRIWDALERMRVSGGSALYDAIKEAVEMADSAPAESGAIRGVVVLAGSPASTGSPLNDVLRMASSSGRIITTCPGFALGESCLDEDGRAVPEAEMHGFNLAVDTQHRVGVYFIGVGETADLEIGRMLSEATGSNFLGTTVEDLAPVVQLFSVYF
jgi:Ca-activated chloride channel homolog